MSRCLGVALLVMLVGGASPSTDAAPQSTCQDGNCPADIASMLQAHVKVQELAIDDHLSSALSDEQKSETVEEKQCNPHPHQPYDWTRVDSNYNAAAGCNDESDCFGNGVCCGGQCVCKTGWRGPFCGMLDLLPANNDEDKQGIEMNGKHPTWGGAAWFEGNKWYFLGAGKHIKSGNFNPKWKWQREPAYKNSKWNNGKDPWLGGNPYDFEIKSPDDPLPNDAKQVNSLDLYEKRSWISLYESSGDATGPYNEKVAKWFRAFRADLKKVPNGPLLMLSNANGGFNIIASTSGKLNDQWTDKDGNNLLSEWANFRGSSVPDDNTKLPPPVYKFGDHGHCVKGWKSLTDANGNSLADEYATKNAPTDAHFHKCSDDELDKWNCHMADPALLVKQTPDADGDYNVIIAFRGTKCKCKAGSPGCKNGVDHKERIGMLTAKTWNGDYTAQSNPIFADGDPKGPMDGGLEDLFMWEDSSGGVHMVVHSQAQDHAHGCAEAYDDGKGAFLNAGSGNGCRHQTDTFNHKKKRGAALYSVDGLSNWKLSNWELFPSEIYQEDGRTRFLLKQQRPSLIFDSTGNPTHLISGVDYLYDPCCDWYAYGSGFTLIQKVSQCPAGEVMTGGTCTACTPADVTGDTNSRCRTATSKYGKCVCADCSGFYSGDSCQEEPPWVTTCQPITTGTKCGGGATATKFFVKADGSNKKWGMDECQSVCEQYATAMLGGKAGCCMSFRSAANAPDGNCRFESSAGLDSQGFPRTHASKCRKHRKGQAPPLPW